MSLPQRLRGVKVLKAISSPIRLQVLNLLFDKGGLSYTELMNSLKMNPTRDAGRFGYHLKFLLKVALVEADVETKKYILTDLGKTVIDVADRVEKKALKPRGMLVRTSRSTLEAFEASKITNSLIKEAKIPVEIAQKTAKDAEKLLLKSKIKYLTAPLVREVVNAILIERGLEDYRHKLTRLGMPVHEVAALVEAKTEVQGSAPILAKAGKHVLSEYTLLNVFPRDISDAHVSGAIHVNDLGTWLLKPDEVIHDVRFFLQKGLQSTSPYQHTTRAPQDLGSALSVAFSVLLHSSSEVNRMQTIPYFNIFLAPFARGLEAQKLKDHLRLFISSVNQHVEATFGLSLTAPKFVADKQAIGPEGRATGTYGDFEGESRLIAQLTLDVVSEETLLKPMLNPRLIVEIDFEALGDETAKEALLKAHMIAEAGEPIYFHNATQKSKRFALFSGMGCRYQNELTSDWETDALRTGCIGTVNINLPRVSHESERDKAKFMEILKERYELAARALEMKQRALRQHGRNSLCFLSQSANGDTYFRSENCLSVVNFVGLKESVEAFSQTSLQSTESLQLIDEITQAISSLRGKTGRKLGKRLFTAILPNHKASERLAQLDIEEYGLAKVKFSGTRERPFYSTAVRPQVEGSTPLRVAPELLEVHRKIKNFCTGGNLAIVELQGPKYKPEDLMTLTNQFIEKENIEFLTYNRRTSYCSNCQKSYPGVLHKCPSCGTISSLILFDRFGYT